MPAMYPRLILGYAKGSRDQLVLLQSGSGHGYEEVGLDELKANLVRNLWISLS